jgi:hypothetical protein
MPEPTTSTGAPPRTAGGLLAAPVDGDDHVDGPGDGRATLVLDGRRYAGAHRSRELGAAIRAATLAAG